MFLHPNKRTENPIVRSEYYTIILTLIISLIAMLFYIIYCIKTNILAIAFAITIASALNIISLIILRFQSKTNSKLIAGNLVCLSMLILFLVTYVISFNKTTPAIIWFAIYPLISILSTNFKIGTIWSLFYSLLGLSITYYMTTNSIHFHFYTDKNTFIGTMMNITFAPLITLLLIKANNSVKKEALCSLDKSLKENKQLLSILAHDIANPIQVIQLVTIQLKQLVNADHSSKIKQIKIIDKIIRSTEIMTEISANVRKQIIHKKHHNMINDNDNDNDNFELKKVSIQNIFDDIKNLFEEKFDQKNITFDKKSSLKDVFVLSNKSILFNNIIQNLISNAIKFTPESGMISFDCSSTESDEAFVKIKIRDNGVGISKEKIPLLFKDDNAENLSTTGTMGELGSGLGLPIVFQTVKHLNGEISITSVNTGANMGTEFTLTLPKYISNKTNETPET